MTAILGKFSKQPGETLDYSVDFTDWFAGRPDAPQSYAVTVESGLTKEADFLNGNVVKIVLSGGTSGMKYKVTVSLTTNATPAIVKEVDFIVSVKAV